MPSWELIMASDLGVYIAGSVDPYGTLLSKNGALPKRKVKGLKPDLDVAPVKLKTNKTTSWTCRAHSATRRSVRKKAMSRQNRREHELASGMLPMERSVS